MQTNFWDYKIKPLRCYFFLKFLLMIHLWNDTLKMSSLKYKLKFSEHLGSEQFHVLLICFEHSYAHHDPKTRHYYLFPFFKWNTEIKYSSVAVELVNTSAWIWIQSWLRADTCNFYVVSLLIRSSNLYYFYTFKISTSFKSKCIIKMFANYPGTFSGEDT